MAERLSGLAQQCDGFNWCKHIEPPFLMVGLKNVMVACWPTGGDSKEVLLLMQGEILLHNIAAEDQGRGGSLYR